MISDTKETDLTEGTKPIELVDFLESIPPGKLVCVNNLVNFPPPHHSARLSTPDIQLHCTNDVCNGLRFFKCVSEGQFFSENQIHYQFLRYVCRNCQNSHKSFAVAAIREKNDKEAKILKIGEWPPFGPPTPPRVISLIGPDRDLFLTGRRAENQGMGIGAFAYYRRVVENQKNRIFDEIIRVLEKLHGYQEYVEQITKAKSQTQFTKAVEALDDTIPDVLRIDGHNPLTLLHSALSRGLHAQTDIECLELANSIRVVLTELAERIGQVLKDEKELKEAVSRLLKDKS